MSGYLPQSHRVRVTEGTEDAQSGVVGGVLLRVRMGMDAIEIIPAAGAFRKTIRVPGSKSITNRALPLAALAEGVTELTGVLFADDTWQMINALQTLG